MCLASIGYKDELKQKLRKSLKEAPTLHDRREGGTERRVEETERSAETERERERKRERVREKHREGERHSDKKERKIQRERERGENTETEKEG